MLPLLEQLVVSAISLKNSILCHKLTLNFPVFAMNVDQHVITYNYETLDKTILQPFKVKRLQSQ